MYELIQLSDISYYVVSPAKIGIVKLSESEVCLIDSGNDKEAAKKVGITIAQRAIEKGISEVVFDRGGYIYHGRVSELAEGAREGGLKF